VAKATGLSTCTIHRARGDMIGRCTLDTLTSIAGALGVKVKDLFEEG
jgi:DNA-binding Xre family transcriptional regulator